MGNIPEAIPAYVLKAQELQRLWGEGITAFIGYYNAKPRKVKAAQKALDGLADVIRTSISLKPPAECQDLHNILIQTFTGSMNAIISQTKGEDSSALVRDSQENYTILHAEIQRLADQFGVG